MCSIFKYSIDCISGSKNGFSPCFDICTRMRVKTGITVLIIGVACKIFSGGNFFRESHTCTDNVPIILKAFWTVDNCLFPKWNREIDFPFLNIDKCGWHGVFELNDAISSGSPDFKSNTVSFFIFIGIDKAYNLIRFTGHQCVTVLIQYF